MLNRLYVAASCSSSAPTLNDLDRMSRVCLSVVLNIEQLPVRSRPTTRMRNPWADQTRFAEKQLTIFEDPMNRLARQLSRVCDSQFLFNTPTMRFDRFYAQVQLRGYFHRRVPLTNQLKHFEFSF